MKKIAVLVIITTLAIPMRVNAIELNVPQDIQKSCEKWGDEYGICPELLEAISFKESSWRANVDNGNCKGLCQINVRLFKERMNHLGITDIHDADQNIHLCADILYDYFREDDDIYRTLAMYNYGSNKGKAIYDEVIFTDYAEAVVNLAEKFERQHGK